MAEAHRDFTQVDGGRVEVWQREDGVFGVSLLPDDIRHPGYPGRSFLSTEGHDGFPDEYNAEGLKAWGRALWDRLDH
jgi:hypothetical protein